MAKKNSWQWLEWHNTDEKTENSQKWLEIARISGNGWTWLEMAGNDLK